ncbi:hypothetical protein [Flyfo microvirus Tbat2_83]|nr:hypothetical protein [Flyfo microvirus Tbat2_83]
MQKFGMIAAFVELTETDDATFVHPEGQADQARQIKMRINAEQAVSLWVVPVEFDYDYVDPQTGERVGQVVEHHDDPEFTRFLAHIEPGLDQLEFYYQGSFCLRVKGGNIWLDTYDNTAFNVESVDPVSFARLWERDERDPRILEIERAARHNQNLLRAEMERDRAEFAAMMAEMKNSVTPAPSAPVPSNGSTQTEGTSVPPASDQQPDPAATPPAGGNA